MWGLCFRVNSKSYRPYHEWCPGTFGKVTRPECFAVVDIQVHRGLLLQYRLITSRFDVRHVSLDGCLSYPDSHHLILPAR